MLYTTSRDKNHATVALPAAHAHRLARLARLRGWTLEQTTGWLLELGESSFDAEVDACAEAALGFYPLMPDGSLDPGVTATLTAAGWIDGPLEA